MAVDALELPGNTGPYSRRGDYSSPKLRGGAREALNGLDLIGPLGLPPNAWRRGAVFPTTPVPPGFARATPPYFTFGRLQRCSTAGSECGTRLPRPTPRTPRTPRTQRTPRPAPRTPRPQPPSGAPGRAPLPKGHILTDEVVHHLIGELREELGYPP